MKHLNTLVSCVLCGKMKNLTLSVPDELRHEMKEFAWLNWSEIAREAFLKKMKQLRMLKKLESKEEQDLIKWSVELGRRAKKGRFKELLSEISPKTREKLLKEIAPKKRQELLE